MGLLIRKVETQLPDSDGDVSLTGSLEVDNDTSDVVRFIRTTSALLNASGSLVSASPDVDDHWGALEPGETLRCTTNPRVLNVHVLRNRQYALRVYARLHAREHTQLGEIEVPLSSDTAALLQASISSHVLGEEVRLAVRRDRSYDDQVGVRWTMVALNLQDVHLPKVVLSTELLDGDGATLESNKDEAEWSARFPGRIDGSFWSLQPSLLRGARLRFSLAVFRPVGFATGEYSGVIPSI